jgi:hypothetical protein
MTSSSHMSRNAELLGERVRAEDGVGVAVRALERIVRQPV